LPLRIAWIIHFSQNFAQGKYIPITHFSPREI
jgi:hypothetical protein